ncbi:MAG: exopolysaccharide biosynthesis polyprenyl glycosylphosphotransferase [Candidatus Moranbacteria bacterium]|nr:exopolysaccharide biosynthesis polyprenyl glycosylphosphotransferase [Candidatus Moranbacteria bacterium]
MKRSEIFFNIILVPIDYFAIVISVLIAYYIRFHPYFEKFFKTQAEESLSFQAYTSGALLIAAFIIIVFAFEGMYVMRTTRSKVRESYKIISASSTALFLLIIAAFFFKKEILFLSSRFIILTSWPLAIFLVFLGRYLIKKIQQYLVTKKRIGIHRVLIIGKNRISKKFKQIYKANPGLGLKVIGVLDDFDWERLQKIKKWRGIDEIIQTDVNLLKSKNNMLIRFCDIYKVDYKYVPNLYETKSNNIKISNFAGYPLIELGKTPLEGWMRVIKRVFDIIFALTFILFFSPVYILVTLLIKLESKGAVLYKDYRVGQKKEKFVFYKFRSMKAELCDGELGTKKGNLILNKLIENQKKNTRKGSPLHKIKDDPRITKVGRFIRRYSLDEFPGFFNVLKGDMSVVGYRPHTTREVESYNYDQQRMFYIKPGITGLAQISGRSDLNFDEEVKLDVYYMENWSLALDIYIILKTPMAVFKKRKVE